MEVEMLKSKDKNVSSFALKKSTAAFANAIRRSILTEVPTMAIESIEFIKNSGALYDEMIALRLGLVVLKTDLKSYNLPENCTCNGEGCAQCQLKLTLKVKGPGYVYASDIKSQDPKVEPVHGKTIITKLMKGQEMEFVATAVLGKGKNHAKWVPALVYYKHPAEISIKDSSKDVEEAVKSCPLKILEDKNGKIAVNKDRLGTCHLCLSCQDTSKGNVQISENENTFAFNVEPWGQLDLKTMIKKSIESLNSRCDEFTEKMKAL